MHSGGDNGGCGGAGIAGCQGSGTSCPSALQRNLIWGAGLGRLGAAVCAHGNLRASTGGSRSFDVAISEGAFVVRKDTAARFNHPVYAPQKPNSPGADNGGLQTAPGWAPLEPPGYAAPPAFYAVTFPMRNANFTASDDNAGTRPPEPFSCGYLAPEVGGGGPSHSSWFKRCVPPGEVAQVAPGCPQGPGGLGPCSP